MLKARVQSCQPARNRKRGPNPVEFATFAMTAAAVALAAAALVFGLRRRDGGITVQTAADQTRDSLAQVVALASKSSRNYNQSQLAGRLQPDRREPKRRSSAYGRTAPDPGARGDPDARPAPRGSHPAGGRGSRQVERQIGRSYGPAPGTSGGDRRRPAQYHRAVGGGGEPAGHSLQQASARRHRPDPDGRPGAQYAAAGCL